MKKIPLTRPQFDGEELKLIQSCLSSGWVTQGPMVSEFQRKFSKLHGVKHALATTSCTAALHLAALALELGPGDEVIVPALTWVTSANCAEYVGAKVVFADIDLQTYNLDPEALASAITPRTKAIVVVHLFGLSAPMDEIRAIAQKHGLRVIEDAACAVGATYAKEPVGGLGDIGCFSFHPRKIITSGEGGMVTTDSDQLAEKIASFRNHGVIGGSESGPHGTPQPYHMACIGRLGFNLRMSDIQGAVALAQLKKLEKLLQERKKWAARYDETLPVETPELLVPFVPQRCGHTYQSYVVRLGEGGNLRRNSLMERLAERGIWTRPGTHAVHRLPIYKEKYRIRPEQFPNAVRGEDETITLPLYPGMIEEDFDYILIQLKKACEV